MAAATTGRVGAAPSQACAPGYKPCLPVRQDLDCRQIDPAKKPVRVTGRDPYRLDPERDGVACIANGAGRGSESRWGLVLRTRDGKEARSAAVGDSLIAYGWSPNRMEGRRFRLCNVVTAGIGSRVTCAEQVGQRGRLSRGLQTFGTWVVRPDQGARGVFRLTLRSNGRARALDTLRLR